MENKREFVLYSGCIEHGLTLRTGKSLNICSNSECSSCKMFSEALTKEMESWEPLHPKESFTMPKAYGITPEELKEIINKIYKTD